MDVYDISRSVSPATAVWPGDQPVEWSWIAKLKEGESVNLGHLSLSPHTGTHVDAPYHVHEEGDTVDELPLSTFVGRTEVIRVHGTEAVRPDHLPEPPHPSRLLFQTPASEGSDEDWPDSIVSIAPETVQALDERGGVLLGTDAPSVDPLESKTLRAHHALRRAGIVHLEGLSLDGVQPGRYTLLALPLKLTGAEAAPVRAVLAPVDFPLQEG